MNPQPVLKQPFSNIQLELLKLFADDIPEQDLKVIQRMIVRYFAEKASAEADEIWSEKGYSAEELLKENMRTPYKSAKK